MFPGFHIKRDFFKEPYDFWSITELNLYFSPFSSRTPSDWKQKPRPGERAAIESGDYAAAAQGQGQAQHVQLPTETPAGTNSSRGAIQGLTELQIS